LGGGGQISPSPIDFHRRPYNTLALPCERVMTLCPSACLSVTSRSSTKTTKHGITQTTPHDSPGILVYCCQRFFSKIRRGSTTTGPPNAGGMGYNRRLLTKITNYISKTVQDRRIVSIKSNRKSYVLYRMATLPVTLSDP